MTVFDDCYHAVMNTPVPANQSKAKKPQFCYGCPHSSNVAFLHQDAILKEMRNAQQGGEVKVNPETDIGKAVLHNLQLTSRSAEWIDLDTALKGPDHVATLLIRKL